MSLTVSLGFEAKYWVALAIAVYSENRNTDIVVLHIAAITCGIAPHLTGETSSLNTTSRTQCTLFSIAQCPRCPVSKRSADASSGRRLVLPYWTLCVQPNAFASVGWARAQVAIDVHLLWPAHQTDNDKRKDWLQRMSFTFFIARVWHFC